ncbi:MAG TPA: O-antigen ligase family protein, partial [Candidatus Polarisedimenticolaceae bacterium]|nr:O-antigen ligase family protein [Candidatus Polarisedimenticolaceae bacterium]
MSVRAAALLLLLAIATIGQGGSAAAALLAEHLVLVAVVGIVLVRAGVPELTVHPVVAAGVAGFAAFALFGALRAPYGFAAWLVLEEIAAFITVFVLASRSEPGLLRALASGLALVGAGQAAVAIAQRLALGVLRPAAGFLNPNHLAAWLVMAACVASGAAWARPGVIGRALIAAVAAMSAALLVIGSRGALVGLAAGVATALLLTLEGMDRAQRRRAGIAALAFVALGAAGVALRFRVADPFGSSRTRIWRSAASAIADDPWTGTGAGQFEIRAANLNFPRSDTPLRFERSFYTPHSDWLRAPIEFGIPAALAIAAALGAGVVVVGRSLRRDPDPLRVGAAAALAALIAQGAVDDLTETPGVYLAAAALAGCLLAVPRSVALAAATRRLRLAAAVALLPTLVAVDVAAYRAWSIQASLPRGGLTDAQRVALARARGLNPFQADLAIRAADDLVSRAATWTPADYAAAREAAEQAVRLSPRSSASWLALARVQTAACRDLFRDVGTR